MEPKDTKGETKEKNPSNFKSAIDDHEIDINELFQGLESPIEYSKLLVPPNATNIDEIVKVANGDQTPSAASSVVGTLIKPKGWNY